MISKFRLLRMQGVRDPFMPMYNDFGKSDPPPAPDYIGAANATAQGNLEAARAGSAANRVNQITPYGNLTYNQTPTQTLDATSYQKAYQAWQKGGSKGAAPAAENYMSYNPDAGWTATQTLTPAQQAILEKNQGLSSGLLDTAQQGLNYAQDVISKPGVDLSNLPSYGINPGETYSDAIMRRLQPQMQEQSQAFDAKMANQGVMPGTAAYDAAYRNFVQGQNDQRTSAITGGMGVGLNANQQAFTQQAYNQMQPINVINALRTGSQVQNPSFVNTPQQATTQGADILGATNAQYTNQLNATNASNAASGNFMGGLMNLGGAAIKYSDRRLKTNIEKIGEMANGLSLYAYDYIWGEHDTGVMADEVEKIMPEAVITMPNGFKAVNYAMLGA